MAPDTPASANRSGQNNGALRAAQMHACHRGSLPFRPPHRLLTAQGIASPDYARPRLCRISDDPSMLGAARQATMNAGKRAEACAGATDPRHG
jgi:hypothetical protein